MVTLELKDEDARFLSEQLAQQFAHVESELVHSDTRNLQRELAADLRHLESLRAALTAALDRAGPRAT
ncbi:MAG: hypothetical protein HOW73_35725 [Polyangiaceae bacterium]|nr:hypothetical protein [Polyangiaceae bacterium]